MGLFAKEGEYGRQLRWGRLFGLFILFIILFILLFSMFVIISAGEVGVKFDPFRGGVQSEEFTEGFHFKAPWVRVDRYNIKTHDYTMSRLVEEGQEKRDDRIRTVTKEGLYVDLDLTILYKINPMKADEIRKSIGVDGQYQKIVVRPTVRNSVREVISNYDAGDIYGEKRPVVEQEMYNRISDQLSARDVIVEGVLLRDVGLPSELTKSIEEKKTAEQQALRMEYILQQERLEKERKIIEAEGITKANDIIAGSLTRNYLTWYWIDNLDTHESVIYVPVGEGGVPLFKEVSEVP
ncbi:MAG: prohibitin family protein [Halobacteriota archaeon]|nr:prohibitin family protein [Halobacteriota archaeon]